MAGFKAAGHEVRFGSTRNPGCTVPSNTFCWPAGPACRVVCYLGRAIARFAPDLILIVTAYHTPPPILDYLASLPNRPPMLGWVGDRFSSEHRRVAALFDRCRYTDTGLLALHKELGFACRRYSCRMPRTRAWMRQRMRRCPGDPTWCSWPTRQNIDWRWSANPNTIAAIRTRLGAPAQRLPSRSMRAASGSKNLRRSIALILGAERAQRTQRHGRAQPASLRPLSRRHTCGRRQSGRSAAVLRAGATKCWCTVTPMS